MDLKPKNGYFRNLGRWYTEHRKQKLYQIYQDIRQSNCLDFGTQTEDRRQDFCCRTLENGEEVSEIILKQEIKNIGKRGENVSNNWKIGKGRQLKKEKTQKWFSSSYFPKLMSFVCTLQFVQPFSQKQIRWRSWLKGSVDHLLSLSSFDVSFKLIQNTSIVWKWKGDWEEWTRDPTEKWTDSQKTESCDQK